MRKLKALALVLILIMLPIGLRGSVEETPPSLVEQALENPAGQWAGEEYSIYYIQGVTATFSDDISKEDKRLQVAWLQVSLDMLPPHLLNAVDGLLVSFNTGRTCVRETAIGCFTTQNFSIFFGLDNINTETDALALLLHEIGHAVDYSLMKEEGRGSDFRSTENASILPEELHANDAVVSGYSRTNPKEDFAESFFAYIMYPNHFKRCCSERYEFLKNDIFLGKEYKEDFPITGNVKSKFASRFTVR